MVDIANLSVWTATNGKKWVAATSTAPYFCFEADSEQAALAVAGRALRFYLQHAAQFEETRERVYPAFLASKKVSAKELAGA